MNYAAVLQQLNDLPNPFLRQGTTFAQFQAANANGLVAYTDATDAINSQINSIETAYFGWLDMWGLLFGLVRNANESDYVYRNRIEATLLAAVGTIPGIELWGAFILNGPVNVTENFPAFGYTITIPSGLSPALINFFIYNLARIRPAGVPFSVNYDTGGMFLETINFLGAPRVTGAYLGGSDTAVPITGGGLTPNSIPLLPSLYLTDPTLNPSLVSTT